MFTKNTKEVYDCITNGVAIEKLKKEILYMDLENVKLIFADLDDTLSELYKPASKKVKEYLNRLLQEGKSIVIISGQGRDNIYDRVVCGIEENLRRKILVCGCGGAYIYGFDNDGKFEKNPIYSISEEKLNIEQRKVWREKMIARGKELMQEANLPIGVFKGGEYAIDFMVNGVSKTYAVKYLMNNTEALKKIGVNNPEKLDDENIQVWGDKYSLINGGTDMNMLYGLNKNVLALDFRKEPIEELDMSYNIKIWNGKKTLYEGLEEYLKLNLEKNNGEKI